MKANTAIYVSYDDSNEGRLTTAKELEIFFKEEGKEWRMYFFDALISMRKFRTNFALYTLDPQIGITYNKEK